MRQKWFSRGDFLAAAISTLISLAVYLWGAAPNVTLLDSGEFVVAAQHFGVPHPTGYPLWTMLNWLFLRLPLGNAAWEVAVFSGLCGALATGLCALLSSSAIRWILDGSLKKTAAFIPGLCAVAFALCFAFSFSMWSQSEIAEVYSLHALLIGCYLLALYCWLRNRNSTAAIYWTFFTLSLAFSNHQLTVALALLPFLVALLVRRDIFWDLVAAAGACLLIAYLGFALLSEETPVAKAAIRLAWCFFTGFVFLVIIRKGRVEWRFIGILPLVVFLGLLPYAYLPIASSTNPPMNWGYTKTVEGFFYSFNRSQYRGSLSDQILRTLGRLLGVPPQGLPAERGAAGSIDADGAGPPGKSLVKRTSEWAQFFWVELARNFTPFAALAFFLAFFVVFRVELEKRVLVYLLILAFTLAAFLQPVLDRAGTDNSSWWQQMPYHTHTNLIFAVVCSIGAAASLVWLVERLPRARWMCWLIAALPLWPLAVNERGCSQRNHWFGWKYGHDMLAGLPRGSIIFGGTDPGRFVPTYMIFGESTLPPSARRDPLFDRSDLYIITQNALSDPLYRSYIFDQYGQPRLPVSNAFEKWLGRGTIYPEPLILPTREMLHGIRMDAFAQLRQTGSADSREVMESLHSAVAKWIFDKNKDRHSFFVEESFPMKWTYDYAIPEGLTYRINQEPLKELPQDLVDKDFRFWDAYIADLKSDPNFDRDFDAQRSFSKLRVTGGNIYTHRKMFSEAERAYRQSLSLWPGNTEALAGLARRMMEMKRFEEVIDLYRDAHSRDPNNTDLLQCAAFALKRNSLEGEIRTAEKEFEGQPKSFELFKRLSNYYYQCGDTNQLLRVFETSLPRFNTQPEALGFITRSYGKLSKFKEGADTARQWTIADPRDAEAQLLLAKCLLALEKKEESLAALQEAVELGGIAMRERIFSDSQFSSSLRDEDFRKPRLPNATAEAPAE